MHSTLAIYFTLLITSAALTNSAFTAVNPVNPPSWPTSTLPIPGLTTNSLTTTSYPSPGPGTTVIPIWFETIGTGILILPTDEPFPGVSIYPPPGYPALTIGSDGVLTQLGMTATVGSTAATTASAGSGASTTGGTGLTGSGVLDGSGTGTGAAISASGTADSGSGSAGEIAGGAAAGVAGVAGVAAAGVGVGSGAGSAGGVAAGSESAGDLDPGEEGTDDNGENENENNNNNSLSQSQGLSGTQTLSLPAFSTQSQSQSQSQALTTGTPFFATSATLVPTASEIQNWTIPSISIDPNGIASVAALLYSALSSSAALGGSVSTALGTTEAAGLSTTGTAAAASTSSAPAAGFDVESYCHDALGNSSGSVCVYVPPAPGDGKV